MPILISKSILTCIEEEIIKSKKSFVVISAFCKVELMEYFESILPSTIKDKKLIVRMRLDDILCGATDLSLYTFCKKHNWKMYFRLDLHAKSYVFDNLRCIIGSANATSSGLNLGGKGNYEMASVSELDEKDYQSIRALFLSSVEMDDLIFNKMCSVVDGWNKKNGNKQVIWPEEITLLYKPDYSIVFAEDFPQCSNPNDSKAEDFVFLNLNKGCDKEQLRNAFESSKCYLWLVNLLKEQKEQEIYFGAATAELHNVLLNDPKPYRKDVKILLSNLFNWIEALECTKVKIDRPNYSQRIKLVHMTYGDNN